MFGCQTINDITKDPEFLERTKLLEGTAKRGSRHVPYVCTSGALTVGYGHNLDTGISERIAQLMLEEDIEVAANMLDRNIAWWRQAPWAVQAVLLDMCFNMGWGTGKSGLSSIKSFLDAMFTRKYRAAADMLWLPGLPAAQQRYKYARDVKERARLNAELLRSIDA